MQTMHAMNFIEDSINKLTGHEREFRIDVRVGTGKREIFCLKACTKKEARVEAVELLQVLAFESQSTVLYRMTGDNNWTLINAQRPVSLVKRTIKKIDEFFFPEFYSDDQEGK